MQYVFSMTSRMVTIALACALLLCVLLFLLGFEIGARFVGPSSATPALAVPSVMGVAPSATTAPAAPAAPIAPAVTTDPSQSGPSTPVPDSSNY
jgi:hypothetical protein